VDEAGQLHLVFQGHRKIPVGEAVVRQAARGEWRGAVFYMDDVWALQMSRR
jgi:hypothetical protein